MQRRTARILIGTVAILWAVGLRAGLRWYHAHHRAGESDADTNREVDALVASFPKLSAPPNPVERSDALSLEPSAVVALLRASRFGELALALETAHHAVEQDFHNEPAIERLLEGFGFATAGDLRTLDAWVRDSPGSFAAHLARGAALVARSRGSGTSCAEVAPMRERARRDLGRALELEPRLVAAYTLMIRTYADAREPAPAELLAHAAGVCPACVRPRVAWMRALHFEKDDARKRMEHFAETSLLLRDENPLLGELAGWVDAEDCRERLSSAEYRAAKAACKRAIAAYPAPAFERLLASALVRDEDSGELPEAEALLTTALAADPSDIEALVLRAHARSRMDDWVGAARDLRRALALSPGEPDAKALVRYIVNRLDSDASQALESGDLADALRVYDEGARAIPERGAFRAARRAVALRLGRASREGPP